jgi:hypothetical protein
MRYEQLLKIQEFPASTRREGALTSNCPDPMMYDQEPPLTGLDTANVWLRDTLLEER